MAIDPSIPLSVRTADFSQGIGLLTRGIERKRERDLQEKQLQVQQANNELQKQEILQRIAQNNKTFSLNEAAEDFVNFDILAESGDTDALRSAVNDRIERLNQRAKDDPSVNSANTQRLADALNQNPDLAKQIIKRQLTGFERLGVIQKSGQGLKTLPAVKLRNTETGQETLVFPQVGSDGVSLVAPTIPQGFEIAEDPADDKSFDQEGKLRKEFLSESNDFIKTRDAHTRVIASAEDPSPAGDLALIFNYMKVLDPGSTVREGEFATAQTAGSVPTRVWSLYNQVIQGTRLTESQRSDFTGRSQKLFDAGLKNQQSLVSKYQDLAKRNNLSPENVVIEFRLPGQVEQREITKDDLSNLSDEELRQLLEQAN